MRGDLRLRIDSQSVGDSCRAAMELLRLMGIEPARVAAITSEPPEDSAVRHEPIRGWSWPDAPERLARLREDGYEAIVLGPEFLDWETPDPHDAINDWLEAFQDRQAALGIITVTVDGYNEEWTELLRKRFHELTDWPIVPVDELLTEVEASYAPDWLCMPYGGLPSVLFDPDDDLADGAGLDGRRILMGFQFWSVDYVLSRDPQPEFAFRYVITMAEGEVLPTIGPIACTLRV